MFDHEIIYQQEIKSTVFIKTELVITITLKLDSQFPKKKKNVLFVQRKFFKSNKKFFILS